MKTAFHEMFTYPGGIRLRAFPFKSIEFLAHWHHDYELACVTSGHQQMGVNHCPLTVSAGQVVLITPSDIHYYVRTEGAEGFLLIFPAETIGHPMPDHATLYDIGCLSRQNELMKLADQLISETTRRETQYEMAADGLLKLFLASLLRPVPGDTLTDIGSPGGKKNTAMQDTLTFIRENSGYPLTREKLATRAHLSVSHFTRLFKATTGLPFTDYITKIRIENACRAISQTEALITEIALDNGFSCIRTFNRVFRKIKGCTPISLRKPRLDES